MYISHPYLVSFYTIPICLFCRIFNSLVSTHFYILLRISLWKGASRRDGNDLIRMHTKFHFDACYRSQVWGVNKSLCCGRHGSDLIRMRVSPPCVLQLASLRSEKRKERKLPIFGRHEYACILSFISMRALVNKFEKWRSNFKQKCLRLFFVV